MTRRRDLLHFNKLAAFQAFCESQGWVNELVKGPYERLRMTKNGREILLVYARSSATEHLTTHGVAEQMARAFISHNHRAPQHS
jgi:hypothetical protein